MSILRSKWLLVPVLLIVGLAVIAYLGRLSVHTERVIAAPAPTIWAVLTDAPGYASWNPVMVKADGEFRTGETITYAFRQPDGQDLEITATVAAMVPDRELNQRGGIPGFITFDHTYRLEPVEGGTRVSITEHYRGFWVHFWDASWIEPAYAEANAALDARVTGAAN